MKVILSSYSVFPFHGYQGINKYVYYLAKYLMGQGVDVEIVTSLDRSKERAKLYEGIKYVFLPPMCVWRKLISPWCHLYNINLAKYLKNKKFDILHSFTNSSYVYLHFENRKPVVTQPFGLEPFTAPSSIDKTHLKKLYLYVLSRHTWKYCLIHAEAVAIEGKFQTEELIKMGIPMEKLSILPVGIDLSFIREQLNRQKISRSEIGLNESDFILISVNRFHPDRGNNYLIDVFNLIKEKIDNARLVLIGEVKGELERVTYEQVLNQITTYGLLEDVVCLKNLPEHQLYQYYSIADVYVSPTLLKDFLMSIQEAMACGLPVVSTGQEFLVKSGINGYVVSERDAGKLADAVITMYINNKCKIMGSMSQRIIKDYDFSEIAKRAVKKYEELCSNRFR